MKDFKLTLTPLRNGLSKSHSQQLPQHMDVLLRLRAPADAPNGATRPALNLSLVLDRSGSMHGKPLEEAKRCASFIVDNLAETDWASLVVFDSAVNVLVPAQPVGNRNALHSALAAIYPGGATALFDGWQQGAELAKVNPLNNGVNRVLLLSDGGANAGLTNHDMIATHCATYANQNITTSTYGLGHGFNEELMVAMAQAGRGNNYYGETADDLMDPFREEFDLLTSLCARNLQLRLQLAPGINASVVNRYACNAQNRWLLPDLAYGGEAWAVLRLQFDREWVAPAEGNDAFLLNATMAFDECTSEQNIKVEAALQLPVLSAAQLAELSDDEIVRARCTELQFADLQEQASQAARAHDWSQVDALLETANAIAADNAWLKESAVKLNEYAKLRQRERFAKESHFKASRLRSRLADPAGESMLNYDYSAEQSKPAYLRRKPEQGKVLKFQGGDTANLAVDSALLENGYNVDDRSDPQQMEVYAWQMREQTRQDAVTLSNEQTKALVGELAQEFGIAAPRVEFKDWALPVAGYETDDHSVLFPSDRANTTMVAHELAHAATHCEYGLAVAGHGPEFVANLVRAMSRGAGERAEYLERSAISERLLDN